VVVLAPTGDRAIVSQPAGVIPSGTDIGKPAIQGHGLEVILIAPAGDRAACPQGTGVAAFLPPWPSAVRAGPLDRPAPCHSALGGDLAAAVQAMTVVGVSNCQFALEAPLYQFYTWPGVTIDQDYSVE
jgi:hypothetical protein